MDAEIINVGTEMLIGDSVSNSQQFLVSELANIDVNVYGTNTAGYDPLRLKELLAIALSRSDVIIIAGGMGPNVEDITKQTVCEALGIALVPHEISRKRIEEYCAHNGVTITPTVLSMADMPAGSVVFRNDNGMCPGCAIRSSKQCIVMLPSSTVEITPMVRNYVIQYLKQLTDGAVFSQVINVFYLGLSFHDVEAKLGNLLNSANPTVKCIEMTGEVRIRVTAKTSSEQASRELAAPVIRQILERFGDDAYGMNVGGLEEVVVRELKERKMTLSSAESCTAGIISKRITDIPGSSRVFEMGATTYSSNKKADVLGVSDKIIQRYGAVSPEAAAAMAVGARRLAGSTLAVSTTGIAGPGGGTPLKPVGLVYIALADRENVWIKKTLIQKPGMDRDYVRQVAASHALNLVRKYINCLPYLMPGGEPLGEGVKESYFSEATVLSPQAIKGFAASVPIASLNASDPSEVPDFVREIVESSTKHQQQVVAQPITQIGSANDPAISPQSGITPTGMADLYGASDYARMGMMQNGMGMNNMNMQQNGMGMNGMNMQQMGMMQQNGMGMNGMNMQQMNMMQQNGMGMNGMNGMNMQQMNMMQQNGMGMNNMNNMNMQQGGKQKKNENRQINSRNAAQKNVQNGKKTLTGRDIAYKIVFVVALITLLGAGGYLLYDTVIEPKMAESKFDQARDNYVGVEIPQANDGVWSGENTTDYDPDRLSNGVLKSFESLINMNSDIVAWVKIPGTVIDYPVVQYADDAAYQRENGEYYYLHRDINKEHDVNGTIFAYYGNVFERDTISKNTIIFGHHMRSGIMFANLLKFDPYTQGANALKFYKENPVMTFNTKYNNSEWVIFAVLKADPASTEFTWIHSTFVDDADFEDFISQIRCRSLINTYGCVDVDKDDYLLVMQTCSYEVSNKEMRTLVVARRLREGETTVDVSGATVASDPVMPMIMR